MEKGFLRVTVSSAYEALPVAAAVITVTLADGTLIYRVTDASGVAERVEADCPDAALSRDETYTGEVFALCDITVEADRYVGATIEAVQLFAGQTAVLAVNMQPVAIGNKYTALNGGTTRQVPPSLVSERFGTATDAGGTAVLDRVVVPDYITVHLGRPTVAAENVTVTFPNYIKNVCCSEIYPTWPESALRANIYCQVSLALNRIFTEWYPSRGYDFDITNSTQFDQYFVYGRNIYSNVSALVDELFDRYIRREGFVEPLFSSYCNGTTATCDGLSQWGSEYLASQGRTPYGILQFFYGEDIVLDEAPIMTGSISSYPGTALRRGDTGNDVRTVQTWLARVRRNYPLIPSPGSVDGVFGAATEAAVKVFQSVFNLTQDGVVGKATWYQLSYIFVSVTRLATLTSEGIQQTPSIPSTTPTTVLRQGSSGDQVRLAQFLLNLAAVFYSGVTAVSVDGQFGALTANSVREFQALRGLTQDGVIGPNTWAGLLNVYYSVQNAAGSPNPAYPGTALRVGSTGANVSLVQRYLNIIGGFYTSITPLVIDGIYGNGTAASVRQFQGLFGLTADGVVGPATWAKLVSVYNALANAVTENTAYPGVPLALASFGPDVGRAQKYLSVIRHKHPSLPDPGTDSIYRPETEAAVRQFQRLMGLPEDGVIGKETWNKMIEEYNDVRGRTSDPVTPSADPPYPGTALRIGSSGASVLWVQQTLNTVAGSYTAIATLAADGKYGSKTAASVTQFQQIFGLSMDGVTGPDTWNNLGIKKSYVQMGGDPVETPRYPGSPLRNGSSGMNVSLVQRYLNRIGQYYTSIPALTQDGIYGSRTTAAVRQFQALFSLSTDGVVGPATWSKLVAIYNSLVSGD